MAWGKLHKKYDLLLKFIIYKPVCCSVGLKILSIEIVLTSLVSVLWRKHLFVIEIIFSSCCCSLTCSILKCVRACVRENVRVCERVRHCQKHIFPSWSLWPSGLWKNNTRGCSRFVPPTVDVSHCSQLLVCMYRCESVLHLLSRKRSSLKPNVTLPFVLLHNSPQHPATRPLYD